jgi:hypothetical protein
MGDIAPNMISYDELDRLFYEHIRLEVVAQGLIPDVTLYANAEDYKAAKEALKATGVELVEVFGVGSYEAREAKSINKIVIDRMGRKKGEIGGAGATYYEKEQSTGKFSKYSFPDTTFHVEYAVHTVGNTTQYDRIMAEIIDKVLGSRRFMPTVDNSGNFTNHLVLVCLDDETAISTYNYLERLYSFICEDVFIKPSKLIAGGIVPLTTVQYTTYGMDDNSNLGTGIIT